MKNDNTLLNDFYKNIDKITKELETINRDIIHCKKGCFFCCIDDITVWEIEAKHIINQIKINCVKIVPHPPGKCVFLNNDGACQIYQFRPYVCRTQGLPLRWIEEQNEEQIEYRDICPINNANDDIITIPPENCLLLGPNEETLARLNILRYGSSDKRFKLREIFEIIRSNECLHSNS